MCKLCKARPQWWFIVWCEEPAYRMCLMEITKSFLTNSSRSEEAAGSTERAAVESSQSRRATHIDTMPLKDMLRRGRAKQFDHCLGWSYSFIRSELLNVCCVATHFESVAEA